MEQIWVNASWSSGMVSQDITFSQEYAPDAYIVTFTVSNQYGHTQSIIIPRIGTIQSLTGVCHVPSMTDGVHEWEDGSRMVTIWSNNKGASFLSARTSSTFPAGCCVPYSIACLYWS